jgi:peptidyl-prolyl cis-trans isomerase A (cyclophilin A)
MRDADEVVVALETSVGHIEIAVDLDSAPLSAAGFLRFVDDGCFTAHGAFYRSVRKDENDHAYPAIDVIQGGWPHPHDSLPSIEHEPTRRTGLRHGDGTVSLARGALGTATGAAFFISIGDQPALDAGGGRNPDGEGFAAFGKVIQGMDTVLEIHRSPTSGFAIDGYRLGQMLDPPIRILRASRMPNQPR